MLGRAKKNIAIQYWAHRRTETHIDSSTHRECDARIKEMGRFVCRAYMISFFFCKRAELLEFFLSIVQPFYLVQGTALAFGSVRSFWKLTVVQHPCFVMNLMLYLSQINKWMSFAKFQPNHSNKKKSNFQKSSAFFPYSNKKSFRKYKTILLILIYKVFPCLKMYCPLVVAIEIFLF